MNLDYIPRNKADIEKFVKFRLEQIEDGTISPLQLKIQLKALSEAISQIDECIKEGYLKEAQKYSKGERNMFGNEFDIVEAGVSYDYSNCGDSEWNDMDAGIKYANTQKKEREKFLQSLKGALEVVDTNSGETSTLFPPVRKSTTTLKITLK